MNSLARLDAEQEWLQPIPGQPPSMIAPPPGCAFHPRCTFSRGRLPCRTDVPDLRQIGQTALHVSACHYADELDEASVVAGAAAQETGR